MTLSFTTLDTETTGLDPSDGHRVIEVALLRYDMTGRLLEQFVERFDPQRAIDPKAQAVHKISYADLAGKPLFGSMAAEMKAVMERGDFIIAHNLPFDAKFMAAEFTGAGVVLPQIPSVDTMHARWATFNGKSPNLHELCFALNVPYDPDSAHGAEYDVQCTAACFLEGLRRGFYTLPTLSK
jgi:DNA polymerase-3 subunit epsilon